EVKSKAPLDCGIYAHQVRVDPSNKAVLIPARGNGPTAARPEDPGSIKIFSYNKGMLENQQTVAPERGFGFQVRHLDFHPSGKWTFITLERQNQIHVYERKPDGTLSTSPVYVKDSITPKERQAVGTIHFHPNGKFLYVANRSSGTVEFEGKRVAAGGENNIAVFSINLESGEPTMIQSVDTRGFQPRCFSLDASGRFLVVANQSAMLVRSGNKVAEVPASLALFRVGADGKLEFVRKYDVATGPNRPLFWAGFVAVS
ncbi:MAG: lactonase family protein, partial [Candidatus Korobacteraceae bacterium]